MRGYIWGAVGLLVGSTVTYLLTKTKYETIVEEEIAKARLYFDEKMAKATSSVDVKEDVVEKVTVVKNYTPSKKDSHVDPRGYSKYMTDETFAQREEPNEELRGIEEETMYGMDPNDPSDCMALTEEECEAYENEVLGDREIHNIAYVIISEEEYTENFGDWPLETIFYNGNDESFLDVHNRPLAIPGHEAVGTQAMDYLRELVHGEVPGADDSIFVQNHKQHRVFEVIIM